MTRRMLVAGNWKMNGLVDDSHTVAAIADAAERHPQVDVALCVPATLIVPFGAVAGDRLQLGAQDCHHEVKGAFTGSVSASQLRDAGARIVIVGHSERRQHLSETDALVAAKAQAALDAGLDVILCVGEPLAVREAGRAGEVVVAQMLASLPNLPDRLDRLTIAYEPIWAIGTGLAATPADARAMHVALRAALANHHGADTANQVRILYGGSVTGDNAADLFASPDVDGALVGGASLTRDGFAPIVRAAASLERGAALG